MSKRKEMLDEEDSSDVSCVVSGSLALVLRASRALAMSPLSVTRARAAWRVAPSHTLAVRQRLLITALNISIAAVFVWEFCEEPKKRVRLGDTALKTIVCISDFLIMTVLCSITAYTGPSRMRNLIQVLKKLQQINFELKINPPSAKSEKMRSLVMICIVTLVITLQIVDIQDLTLGAFRENKCWLVMGPFSVYYYYNVMLVMIELQWYYAVRGAHAASAALNRQLQQLRYANFMSESKMAQDDLSAAQSVCTLVNNLTTQTKSDAGIPIFLTQAQAQIRRLAVSYDRISEVILQLTAYNGATMLLTVIAYSSRLVISPYYLLLNIFDDDSSDWSYTLLQVCWNTYFVLNLLLIVEPCQWTQDQRQRTQFLLGQLTLHLAPKCERLAHELDQFVKHVQLNNAKFVPLGIFTLSRSLMVTILGSATTYLLIIVQFQKISDLM